MRLGVVVAVATGLAIVVVVRWRIRLTAPLPNIEWEGW